MNYLQLQIIPKDEQKTMELLTGYYRIIEEGRNATSITYRISDSLDNRDMSDLLQKAHIPHKLQKWNQQELLATLYYTFSQNGEAILNMWVENFGDMTTEDNRDPSGMKEVIWHKQDEARKIYLTKQLLKGDINED